MRDEPTTITPTDANAAVDTDPVAAPHLLPIGARLAEFEIKGVVGEGGFGTVYLAFDHSLLRTVALKEYLPTALARRAGVSLNVVRSERHRQTFEAGMTSFINEARLLAQFDHPALVKVYRFWEANNTAYLAMPYYEGVNFRQFISNAPDRINQSYLRDMLAPLLDALEALHQAQIFHRDIAPDNIMIVQGGQPVLLDFGAARRVISNLTQALTVILKPGFAPLEQYADDPSLRQGPWTDIYALSAVLYYALLQKAPPAAVSRMSKDSLQPLVDEPSLVDYDRSFLAAIDQGLVVLPHQRVQTIAEFRAKLGIQNSLRPAGREVAQAGSPASEPVDDLPKTQAYLPDLSPDADFARFTADAHLHAAPESGDGFVAVRNAAPPAFSIDPALLADDWQPPWEPPSREKPAIVPAAVAPLADAFIPAPAPLPIPTASPAINYAPFATATEITQQLAQATPLPPPDRSSPPSLSPAASKAVYWLVAAVGLVTVGVIILLALSGGDPADVSMAPPLATPPPIKAPPPPAAVSSIPEPAAAANPPPMSPPEPANPTALRSMQPVSQINAPGTVFLTIKPWGQVWLNGVNQGVSPPLKMLRLAPGSHSLKIDNPGFAAHSAQVLIKSGQSQRLDYSFH